MGIFNRKPKRTVLVCCGTGCLANGSLEVYREFEKMVKEVDYPAKVKATAKATGCNGLCEMGPIVKILPDDIFYCRVKVSDVEEIVRETLAGGRVVERLLYTNPATGKKVKSHKETAFYKNQLKIALRNIGEIDPKNIDDYIQRGGYRALAKALSKMKPEDVIAEMEKSGLRGRGGAGFPTGRKWRHCAASDGTPRYVLCNGDEGDPGAFMDRSIMEGDPHSIIEGMTIGAYAVGSRQGFIYIRDEYSLALKNMSTAIRQAKGRGFLGENIMGSGFGFDLNIVRGGGAFVCGESSALMASIEGRVGEPRPKYIHATERGLWDKPTVLNNVETWANVPVIIDRGSGWFSSIGTGGSKGTKVFSLVGKVQNTGLIEVPMGINLRKVIFDIGGGIPGGKAFKAVQTGGPSGGCIPGSMLDLEVDFESLSGAGSMMGSGGMIVMDEDTCMVEVARYYTGFLAEESCGKCLPCREGLRRMLGILNDICAGRGRKEDMDTLLEICEVLREASLCGLGKTAPNPVETTLRYFREEYLEHIRDKRCRAGVCPGLTEYYVEENLCRGCGLCARNCPADAITGKPGGKYTIDPDLCIKCGRCRQVCKFGAVSIGGGALYEDNN
jgi:NADH:ubiquinone oxidoreductase subunit F (NADH-binding)/(2Fe-2S) ferredoxin/NAD-dependent dihydropyrimidine dehydrogenase PreA subunit